jgi:hypothetical protein
VWPGCRDGLQEQHVGAERTTSPIGSKGFSVRQLNIYPEQAVLVRLCTLHDSGTWQGLLVVA